MSVRSPLRIVAVATAMALTLIGAVVVLGGPAAAAAVGPITGLAGKCVDVAGGSPANGTSITLYACNGTGAQQWTVGNPDNSVQALGKCMDVAGAGTANGTRVQLYDCNGTNAQKWTVSGRMLVNTGSGKCLDVTGANSANGTPLQIWTCAGGTNQQWTLPTGTPPPPTTGPTAPPPPPNNGWVHPGVLVSRGQLDFIKGRVQAGAQPWTTAFNQMMASRYASLSRVPAPRAVVECGSFSNPNLGCTDEREDAIAAYTTALAWYITGNAAYAQKSIQLMDAWSATITAHTNTNAPLQTGWAGSSWPRAAEIIRYTYGNWPNAEPVRHHAAQRLPPGGPQRLEQQRQLGTVHDGGRRRHRRVPGGPSRVRHARSPGTSTASGRSSTCPATGRCRTRCRAAGWTPVRRSSTTGKASPPSWPV